MLDFNNAGGGLNPATLNSQEMLEQLNKALSPGYGTDTASFTNGDAMRVQSLDRVLKVITFEESELKLWKSLDAQRARSTVQEYNKLTSWGNTRKSGSFIADGQLPQTRELAMERAHAFVKYMGQTREVTHGMTLVDTAHGDPMTFEQKAGTKDLLFDVEKNLFDGSSANFPLAFDGFITQSISSNGLTSEYVIDLRGGPMTEDVLETAGALIRKGTGLPTDLFMGIDTHADLSKHFFDRGRVSFPQGGTQGKMTAGAPINGFHSNSGVINFKSNAFFTPGTDINPVVGLAAKSSANAPGTPVLGGTPIAVATNVLSEYVTASAGNYVYYLATVNHAGESIAVRCPATGVQAVAAGESVSFSLTYTANGVYSTSNPLGVTCVRVYRGVKGVAAPALADCKLVAEIPTPSGANGTNDLFVEHNNYIPGGAKAIMMDMRPNMACAWYQLLPLIKMDLALLAPVKRFMLLLYGMPILYAPKRTVVFRNIGPYVRA